MARKLLHRKVAPWVCVLAILVAPIGAAVAEIFGTGPGPEILIPYLTEQIKIMESALRTANQKLGAIRALKRGFDRLRHYTLSDAKDDLLYSNRDYRHLWREWRTLKGGGDYYSSNLARLPELLDEIYRLPGTEKEDRVPRRSIFADGVAKEGMVRGEWGSQVRTKEVRKQGQEVLEHGRRAESPGEASKVAAEGTGLLLQAQSDSLAVQSQTLQVQSAHLAVTAAEEFERFRGGEQDSRAIEGGFLGMGPLR